MILEEITRLVAAVELLSMILAGAEPLLVCDYQNKLPNARPCFDGRVLSVSWRVEEREVMDECRYLHW